MTVSETMVERALDAYEAELRNLPGNNSGEPISLSEIRSRCIRAALTAALSDQVVVPKDEKELTLDAAKTAAFADVDQTMAEVYRTPPEDSRT